MSTESRHQHHNCLGICQIKLRLYDLASNQILGYILLISEACVLVHIFVDTIGINIP